MKVLFVEPYESSLFSFRKELLDSLINKGYEVYLCIKSTQRIKDEYQTKVAKIIDVNLNLKNTNILTNLKLKNKYKKIISTFKPDLILSFTIKPNIYCGYYSKKIPMIANITGLGNIFKKNGILSKIGILLYRKSFKNVKCIFFQNSACYDFFVKNKITINDYRIIPGSGVNTNKFIPKPINYSGTINFLYPSRAIEEKGFDILIQAIPHVLDKNKNIHFNFLSAEEDVLANQKACELFKNSKDFISILPRTNNMPDVYAANHFIVAPSFYNEGISNVLLESLSCERPIITTIDNPGCMEVIKDGINGIGVVSNDLTSLINALISAANSSIETITKMGKNGREYVDTFFNRNDVVNVYHKVIRNFFSATELEIKDQYE